MNISGMQLLVIAAGLLPGILGGAALVFFLMPRKTGKEEDTVRHTTFVFSGNLKQTGLIDAIQLLEIGGREGVLHIYCGRRKGYLIFSKGRVIDAFYRNRTGREAVFAMLELDEGDFYFEPKSISQPRLISESIMDLAFEWDEVKREVSENRE